MSSIDNRIVEMQFNNRRFEQNARQSMSTLDKLKEKLNFRSATKELEEFQNASDSFSLNHIANAIDSIGDKFTLLGNLGQQAMQRIANAALTAGTNILKSISIDQISAGMSKYEQETNVVQTLYGALKPKGVDLKEIYGTLEKLTAYSDETSYSYTQMADAVSKFVNAGVDLEKAETVIEGISNAAALAGIGIHDTEIIYRNFADAIGRGGFQLQDWKSIKLAHMDTEWLKKSIIDEAIALGKINKDGKILIKEAKKNAKGIITQAAQYANVYEDFEGTLRRGWLDNDVINAVMLKYANRELENFGKEAFAAAQNAKTFTDVLDAVKDAASTGWSRSFRIVFGELEEAIALFTPMANSIIGIVNRVDEARNTMLQSWRDLGGRNSMVKTIETFLEIANEFVDIIEYGLFDAITNFDDRSKIAYGITNYLAVSLTNLTTSMEMASKAFKEWLSGKMGGTQMSRSGALSAILGGAFSIIAILKQAMDGLTSFGKALFSQLKPVIDPLLNFFTEIGLNISSLNHRLNESKFFIKFGERLAKIFTPITDRLPGVVKSVHKLYQNIAKFLKTNPKWLIYRQSVKNVLNGFINFIPKTIEALINLGKHIVGVVKDSDEWKTIKSNYNKYVKPILDVLREAATRFNNSLASFFNMDTTDAGTLWEKIKKRLSAFDNLGPWFQKKWEELKKQMPWLQEVEKWWNEDPTINAIKEWVEKIGSAIDAFLSADTSGETSIVGKIKKRFEAMWDDLGPWLTEKWNSFKKDYPIFQTIEDFLVGIFGPSDGAEKVANEGEEGTNGLIAALQGIWNKVTEFAAQTSFGDFLKFAGAIATLVEAYKLIRSLAGWVSLGKTIEEAIENVTETIEATYKKVKAEVVKSKAETLLAIAGSLWLMADALLKLSKMDFGQIATGLGAMAVIFAEEAGFMYVLKLLTGNSENTKLAGTIGKLADAVANIGTLISIAINMILMGLYLKLVADIPWDKMSNGLTAMLDIFLAEGVFMGILEILNSNGSKFSAALGNSVLLISIGANLNEVAAALKTLSSIEWSKMENGLTAMLDIFLAEGFFMVIVDVLNGNASKFSSALGNSVLLLSIGTNLKRVATAIEKLSKIGWEEMSNGLTAMLDIFLAEGTFMLIISAINDGATAFGTALANSVTLLSIGKNLEEVSGVIVTLSKLKAAEITQGITAVASIFLGEGSFMWLVSNISGSINTAMLSAASGILGAGIGSIGNSMAKLGKMKWEEIGRGIVGVLVAMLPLGIFLEWLAANSDTLGKIKVKTMLTTVAVAGSIWLLAKAMEPLCKYDIGQIVSGLTGMVGIALILGLFLSAVKEIEAMKITQMLSVLVTAIAFAGLMVAFAFAMTMIKDVDPMSMMAFAAAMALVCVGMNRLAAALTTISKIPLTTALKSIAIIGVSAVVIGAAISLIVSLAGYAMEGFAENIAMVGSYLKLYSEVIEGINYDNVGSSIQMIKDIADAFVYVGGQSYGSLERFKTNLTRMGASVKLFGENTVNADPDKMKSITDALKQMATDLTGFPEVSDVGTSIGHIGGAIKLYSESLNGVDLSKAPDTTAIKTVFDTLKTAIPNDENLTEVAGYATEQKGADMTNFAIGLTNIATAVSTFSTNTKDLNFDNITKATDALTSISKLNTGFSMTAVANFGPFSLELQSQTGSMSTFGEDIVVLGAALKDFGDNLGNTNTGKLNTGVLALSKVADINKKLPKTGGISQWLTGTVSLSHFAGQLQLLGEGAKNFSTAISGTTFDPTSVKNAGDALISIAEVNRVLPKTGGISSWFTGDQDLSNFGKDLGGLGEGMAKFAGAFGETKITEDVVDGITQLNRIAGIMVRLSTNNAWYDIASLASQLKEAAGSFIEFNTKITGVEWADSSKVESLLTTSINAMNDLAKVPKDVKGLKEAGQDLHDFVAELAFFTWTPEKLQNAVDILGSIDGIFKSLKNDTEFTTTGEDVTLVIVEGMADAISKTNIAENVDKVCIEIRNAFQGYTNTFYYVGTMIPAGVASGIRDRTYDPVNAAIEMVEAVIEASRDTAKVESPSRVFAQIGMYMDQGLANGLTDYISVVGDAAGEVSQEAIDAVLRDIQAINNLPLDKIESKPSIRPVLDTNGIASRAGMIENLIGNQRTIGFNTRQLEAQAQLLGEMNGPDLGSIANQVVSLNEKLDQLRDVVSNLQIVLDTGSLVGGLESKMDKALGARGRRAERGV